MIVEFEPAITLSRDDLDREVPPQAMQQGVGGIPSMASVAGLFSVSAKQRKNMRILRVERFESVLDARPDVIEQRGHVRPMPAV